MKCFGFDPSSGEYLAIDYDTVINGVDTLISPLEDALHIAPAWIDLQVNGYAGVDFNDPEVSFEEIDRAIRVLHSTGTGRFYPTVITGSPDRMLGCVRRLAEARGSCRYGAAIEGIHVEGPHISAAEGARGAHPNAWVRKPDVAEYRRWQDASDGLVRLITIAPEWPDAPEYIAEVVRDGVVASIGHTNATAAQIDSAVRAGASMSTHLGNAAFSEMPKHPNLLWDQLADDRLAAGFIVDGFHVGSAFLKTALRAKGLTRSFLVTDAAMPATAAPGPYKLGEVDVELTEDGRVVLQGGTRLAGSGLRMDHAIVNVMRMAGVSLVEAIAMATRNPARLGRIGGRQRGLTTGDRADFVFWRFDMQNRTLSVEETIVGGETVWSALFS